MNELVAQLVAIRQAKGIKQATVARRMSVTPQAITHFERGSRSPNLTTLQRYSDAIGARITVEDNQQ